MPRHHKDWIAAYLSLVRDRTEAPEIYSFWSAVATVSAALTRNVYIDEVRYKFFPNWIIVLAARPGVAKKSTTIDECAGLLRDLKPELFGPDETNWPDLCRTLSERSQLVRDATEDPNDDHDNPLNGSYEQQCAMTLTLDEFGTFMKPNDEAMITGITSLWGANKRGHVKSTKFSGVDVIRNPFINIIGAAADQWLRDNFRKFAGWGIASRIIFVHTDSDPVRYIWSPAELIDYGEWESERERLKDDLRDIMELRGRVTFTEEAKSVARGWYEDTMRYVSEYARRDNADSWVCDFLARKQVHTHKLAMVLSVCRGTSLRITATDYQDAIGHVDEVEAEIKRVFGIVATPNTAALNERAIYENIHHELSNGLGGSAPKSYILNRIANYVDGTTADRILTSFVRRGLLQDTITRTGIVIRLPDNE